MSTAIDPYHAWLGIATDGRRPNHYQLLGLNLYEEDAGAIRQAAAERIEAVRQHTQGSDADTANRVIAEINDARTVLLSPPDKFQYDAKLRQRPQAAAPVAQTVAQPAPFTDVPIRAVPVDESRDPLENRGSSEAATPAAAMLSTMSGKRRLSTPIVVGSVLGALAMVVLLVFLFSGEPPEDHAGNDKTSRKSGSDRDDSSSSKKQQPKKDTERARLRFPEIAPQATAPGEPVAIDARIEDQAGIDDPISYKLTKKAPRGAKIDPKTGRITWRPTDKHANRRFQFKVLASAGKSDAEELITILVEPSDVLPQAAIASKPAPPEVDPPEKPEPDPTLDPDPEPVKTIARVAIPADADLATARGLADQVYGKRLGAATTIFDRMEVGRSMITTASDPATGSAERYVLLRKGIDVLAASAAIDDALAAVDTLDIQFEVDVWAEKAKLFETMYDAQPSKTDAASKDLALAATKLANQSAKVERFDEAVALLRLANSAARRGSNNELSRLALNRRRELEKMRDEYAPIKRAKEALSANADDPNANLYVGRWQAFVRGDWQQGLPMLAKGSNEMLKSIATDELAAPDEPDAQAALADRWWELANKTDGVMRDQIRKHAVTWYKKALPGLTGLMAEAAQQRIDELDSESADEPMPEADQAGS
ncbi:MAG: hypothetical protein MI757_20790 [Pirellulales bacterium]|nr:hypothetical protein [Pirellulales bacterium]